MQIGRKNDRRSENLSQHQAPSNHYLT